jgi:hypothetical protein
MIGQTISHHRIMDAGGQCQLRRKAVIKMLGVLLLCGCLAGCGSSSGTPTLTGNWQFTLKSSLNGNTYTGTASITQSSDPVDSLGAGSHERMVTGTVNFANDPCATAAPLSGSTNGSNVILTAIEGGVPVSLTGNVSAASTAMSGDYTASYGGCINGDFGSWAASKSKS